MNTPVPPALQPLIDELQAQNKNETIAVESNAPGDQDWWDIRISTVNSASVSLGPTCQPYDEVQVRSVLIYREYAIVLVRLTPLPYDDAPD